MGLKLGDSLYGMRCKAKGAGNRSEGQEGPHPTLRPVVGRPGQTAPTRRVPGETGPGGGEPASAMKRQRGGSQERWSTLEI